MIYALESSDEERNHVADVHTGRIEQARPQNRNKILNECEGKLKPPEIT